MSWIFFDFFVECLATNHNFGYHYTRNNPFPGADRSGEKGLAVIREKVPESVIIYATDPGATAADGTGRNSPFTKAFLSQMETPGKDISVMMKRVTAAVSAATDGNQTPWINSNLSRDFFFYNDNLPAESTKVETAKMESTKTANTAKPKPLELDYQKNLYVGGHFIVGNEQMPLIPLEADADSIDYNSLSADMYRGKFGQFIYIEEGRAAIGQGRDRSNPDRGTNLYYLVFKTGKLVNLTDDGTFSNELLRDYAVESRLVLYQRFLTKKDVTVQEKLCCVNIDGSHDNGIVLDQVLEGACWLDKKGNRALAILSDAKTKTRSYRVWDPKTIPPAYG